MWKYFHSIMESFWRRKMENILDDAKILFYNFLRIGV